MCNGQHQPRWWCHKYTRHSPHGWVLSRGTRSHHERQTAPQSEALCPTSTRTSAHEMGVHAALCSLGWRPGPGPDASLNKPAPPLVDLWRKANHKPFSLMVSSSHTWFRQGLHKCGHLKHLPLLTEIQVACSLLCMWKPVRSVWSCLLAVWWALQLIQYCKIKLCTAYTCHFNNNLWNTADLGVSHSVSWKWWSVIEMNNIKWSTNSFQTAKHV